MSRPVGHPVELAELDLYDVWTTAPALTGRFDPFSFPQRMAAYRALVNASNPGGLFGPDNRGNPLWGLVLQTQWQFRSGRLGTHSRQDGRIDPDAAWGYGNYSVNVIPYLGAVEAGLVPEVDVAEPPGPSRFRYGPEEFGLGVTHWRRYFELIARTPVGSDHEPIRFALWEAHRTCLDVVAARIAHIDPAPYTADELRFLRGWCRMILYLGPAAWRTDFDFMVRHGLDVMPEELLPTTAELPPNARRNVRNVMTLARTPAWKHWGQLQAWRWMMRTRAARDGVVARLEARFGDESTKR